MALLCLHGADVSLAFRQGTFAVSRRGALVRAVRAHGVDEVVCLGAVEVAASARVAALARGVPLVFLTADGRYRGRVDGPRSHTGPLQIAQVRHLAEPERALALARSIVAGKVASERALLLSYQRHRQSPALAEATCILRALLPRIEAAPSTESLMGLEGQAAATYFGTFGHLLRNPDLPWSGRNRRPPRDPVNACLSLGYTLLALRAESALLSVGLLPGVGSLHAGGRGHPALALDLVEELRAPVVDRLVLRLVNRRQLAPEDFEDPRYRRPDFAVPTGGPGAGGGSPVAPGGEAGESAPEPDPLDDPPLPDEDAPPARPDPGDGSPFADPDGDAFSPAAAADGSARGDSPHLPGVRPVYLGPGGRTIFLRAFGEALRGDVLDAESGQRVRVDWLIERQARRLARVFVGREPAYRPFLGA